AHAHPAPEADYQGCHPLYARVDGLLNPRHPPRWWDPFLPRGLWATFRYGRPALRQAIAGGQYEYPQGLFFGGKGPSRTQRLLTRHLPTWVGDARQILHFDIHTGLGPWGKLQLLLEESLETERGRRLADQFGPAVVPLPTASTAATGDYYSAKGEVGGFCRMLLPGRIYDSICAEFGTYPALTVLAALRAENQAHHWGHPDDPATRRARLRLLEVFAPADPTWRQHTLAQGLAMARRAFETMGKAHPAQL